MDLKRRKNGLDMANINIKLVISSEDMAMAFISRHQLLSDCKTPDDYARLAESLSKKAIEEDVRQEIVETGFDVIPYRVGDNFRDPEAVIKAVEDVLRRRFGATRLEREHLPTPGREPARDDGGAAPGQR